MAFNGCDFIEKIDIQNSDIISDYAFANTKIKNLSINTKYIYNKIFYHSDIKSFVLYSVNNISAGIFDYSNCFEKIYYLGDMISWSKVQKGSQPLFFEGQHNISEFDVYYYSETQPTTEGNFWYYDIDGTTILEW